MTTEAQLRKAALGLPEVEEEARSGLVTFSVRGEQFATLTHDGKVQLHLSDADADAAMSAHGTAERLMTGGTGISVPLADVNGQKLNYLVRRAWFSRAPEELVTSLAEADSVSAGDVGDLPSSIGRPATRALAGAGITSLEDVATHTEQELLALHGVGPRAVRILKEMLGIRGQSLRSGPV